MKRISIWLLASVFVLTGPSWAGDLDTIIQGCNDCHGDGGVSQWSDMPSIAGLSEFYHADQLYLFRDGDRPCSDSDYRQGDKSRAATTMCAATADLSDDQIDDIGAMYAEMPFTAAKQDFDAALAASGKAIHDRDCGICHSDGGANPDDDAGILSGQWMGYMKAAFAEYASGDRDQPSTMKKKLDALSDDDVKALLHYYASQQ